VLWALVCDGKTKFILSLIMIFAYFRVRKGGALQSVVFKSKDKSLAGETNNHGMLFSRIEFRFSHADLAMLCKSQTYF
jgi:hypothetical protein